MVGVLGVWGRCGGFSVLFSFLLRGCTHLDYFVLLDFCGVV